MVRPVKEPLHVEGFGAARALKMGTGYPYCARFHMCQTKVRDQRWNSQKQTETFQNPLAYCSAWG